MSRRVSTALLALALCGAGCGLGDIGHGQAAGPVGSDQGFGAGSAPGGAQSDDVGTAGALPTDPAAQPASLPDPPRFACGGQVSPVAQPLRRLSRLQYINTLHDVLAERVGVGLADQLMHAADGALSALPADTVTEHEPFARMDQAVTQQHAETYFNVADELAAELTGDAERRAALLGTCALDAAEADVCVDRLIDGLGRLALRRPLSDADRSFYRDVYGAGGTLSVAGLRDLVTVMLTAPELVYHVEVGGQVADAAAGVYRLNPHELASRLSYHFWQTAPDAELRDLADSGALLDDATFEAQVQRMFDDPRTEQSLGRFTRQWLHLDALRPLHLSLGDPVYDAFVGEHRPSSELTEAMIEEVAASLSHAARVEGGGFQQWFASDQSFARDPELAALYGVPVWDGQSDPPYFPEGERAGLLTRAAVLATGSANTRPIMKGVFIRTRLLCDVIAPPPDNAAANPPELSADQTTRQVVEGLTEQPGTGCAGCHESQINGLGFATEGFDALGRVRREQQLFNEDGSASVALAVDTVSTPRVWLGDMRESTGPQDLMAMILQSGKAEACFARQYLRFTYGRLEDSQLDGCALEAMRQGLMEGRSLGEVMRAVALRPEMRLRAVVGE